MTLAIDVHDLVKRYGTRTVVDRFSLSERQAQAIPASINLAHRVSKNRKRKLRKRRRM